MGARTQPSVQQDGIILAGTEGTPGLVGDIEGGEMRAIYEGEGVGMMEVFVGRGGRTFVGARDLIPRIGRRRYSKGFSILGLRERLRRGRMLLTTRDG